ncbi:MAG: 2-octaprenyl-6-methoxyphenyl hydroxylase [Pseudomonadaceae bacterium]|nr:MAG: 2-octaprenyl-6-methoxyphenyl hydroxylase [Pseudomonadaceae bacterium]
MVGASLALALQAGAKAAGWQIQLIEAQPPKDGGYQPSYDARSTALSQGSCRLFEQLGVWDRLAERVEPIAHIHVSDQGQPGITRLAARDEGVPALGYVVENTWLGEVLLQALDTSVVQWLAPMQVTAADARPGGYELSLKGAAGEQKLTTDLLVVADGGRSGLLDSLGVHRQQRHYGQAAIIANITSSKGHQGVAYERFTPNGPLALLPLSEQRSALVWTLPEERSDAVMALPDNEFLQQLQQAFGYRLGGLTRVGERYAYPLSLIEAAEQVRPHMVVLGNAAHSLHPIAGQGFNLSLRDTLALADHLLAAAGRAQNPGELSLLQAYWQQQQRDQQLTVAFSDRLTRLFSNRQPLLTAGRNLGLLGLDLLPPFKHLLARQAMGLKT